MLVVVLKCGEVGVLFMGVLLWLLKWVVVCGGEF